MLITVGELGQLISEEALESGIDPARVHILADDQRAVNFLHQILQPDDLVLVKGSRAVGMDFIVSQIVINASTTVLH